jgi:hypothetical protein
MLITNFAPVRQSRQAKCVRITPDWRNGRSGAVSAACRATIRPNIAQNGLPRRPDRAKSKRETGSGGFHMGNVGSRKLPPTCRIIGQL